MIEDEGGAVGLSTGEVIKLLNYLGKPAATMTGWTNHLILCGLASRLEKGDETLESMMKAIETS